VVQKRQVLSVIAGQIEADVELKFLESGLRLQGKYPAQNEWHYEIGVELPKAELFEIGKVVFAAAVLGKRGIKIKLLEREREVIEVDREPSFKFENREDRESITERAWDIIPQFLIFQ
jgi:hypothetical protein